MTTAAPGVMGDERQPIPYGQGTSANGGCDECWMVPSRHCCMWNEPDDRPRRAGGDVTSDDAGTLAERIQNVRHILSYATQDEAVERAIDALGEIVAEVGQLRERVRAALIDAEDPWADATSVETYADAVMAVLDEQEG